MNTDGVLLYADICPPKSRYGMGGGLFLPKEGYFIFIFQKNKIV
jgi:hypothetical protein